MIILQGQQIDQSLSKRFWNKVDKDGPIPKHCPELGPCWIWIAAKDKKGYGRFGIQVTPKV